MSNRAVIVAFVHEPERAARVRHFAEQTARDGAILIGADSGGQTLLEWQLKPNLVIGDMDSIAPTSLSALVADGVPTHQSPTEKDETDLELALYAALDMGCRDLIILGGLGGRLDHTLGNLYLLTAPRLVEAGATVRLLDEHEEVFLLRGPASFAPTGQPGEILSLIPLSAVVTNIRTEGLYYPLRGEPLYLGPGRGLSNQFTSPTASIVFDEGLLLVVHTFEPLRL